jgi:hypothetical protein
MLLNYQDQLNSITALEEIVNSVEKRDVVGAYIGLEKDG